MGDSTSTTALATRLINVGGKVARRYVEDARDEAVSDLQRLVTTVVVLATGVLFLFTAIVMGHATAALALVDQGLPWIQALAGLTVLDCVLFLLALAIVRWLFRKPLLAQTRASLGELKDILSED